MGLFQILESYCTTLTPIIAIVKTVLYILQIGIPIVLVLMGTIDLGKAVLSSDDKAIKESTSRLVKRVIAAVAVFFVFTIVKLIMNIISANAVDTGVSGDSSWLQCWNGAEVTEN